MVGIDVSGFQADDVPGDYEFCVVKSTQGTAVSNPKVAAQWQAASRHPRRGLYHYARPNQHAGNIEANYFADDAVARGFQPGKDMWQLDAEGQMNENVAPETWRAYVDAFMGVALARLGKAGYLYIGWPFYLEQYGHDTGTLAKYHWWLPDYGPNDGNVHDFASGVPANLVVIHQFTSHGNLDQNRVANRLVYDAAFGPPQPSEDDSAMGNAINHDGRPIVVYVGKDGRLYYKIRDASGGDWSQANDLSEGKTGFRSVTAWANPDSKLIEVWVVMQNGQIFQRYQTPDFAGWTAWADRTV